MTPEEQVQEIVRRVQAGELSSTDAMNGIVVILQQAGVQGTLEQIQRFAQEAFDRVSTSLTTTTDGTATGGGAKPFFQPQPAPDSQTGPAGDSQLPGGGGTPQTIDEIVAPLNAGTLTPSEAQRLLADIIQQQTGATRAEASQGATSFLLGRVTPDSDAQRALFAAQGFMGTERPGGEAAQTGVIGTPPGGPPWEDSV